MIAKNTKSVIKESELPNKSELVDIEIENYEKFISHLADKKIYKESYDLINSLLEKGWTYENISVYLLNYLFGAKLQNIPDVKVIKYNNFYLPDNKNINKRTAKVNINLGKNQKINPNYILGALVDATGISGKSFGKINIHDNLSLIHI